MTINQKAKMILEELDKTIQIDHAFEEFYLASIEDGLTKIQREEKKANRSTRSARKEKLS